jgi:hypothetical protein
VLLQFGLTLNQVVTLTNAVRLVPCSSRSAVRTRRSIPTLSTRSRTRRRA